MVFSTNPLSLTVPDPTFDSWLRDSGYLEILDRHHSSSASSSSTSSKASSASRTSPSAAFATGFFLPLFSHILTLHSLFTINPFSKLTTEDFSSSPPSWTRAFFADCGSYSIPSGSHQARLRVHENVKRYARNYASLFLLFFACTLYQMPLALDGLISSLALWDFFKFCSEKWRWDESPLISQVLVRTAQFVTLFILIYLNVQMALFCALAVSYAASQGTGGRVPKAVWHKGIVHRILIYCRSSVRPHHQWPVSQKLFTMDVMYLHDKPGSDNCPQEVYDSLVDALEHVSEYGN